ncbi:hypothetical protein HBI16_117230 [Parastagonospora nodorum]|nr:hypothetical protein HBI47_077020 [Parastagonospora nodorum]KAH5772632.1 hypothetical protein HBI16_117230 [Parastagonospora nodorum]
MRSSLDFSLALYRHSSFIAPYISGLNRGPITSVFAPAPSCTQTLRLTADGTNSWLYSGHAYQEYYQSGCMPTGTKVEAALSDKEEWDSYYYSPAICPQSWAPVTTFTSTWFGIDDAKVIPLRPDTTAVLCCPPGYSKGIWAYACASFLAEDTSLSYIVPSSVNGKWEAGDVSVGSFPKGYPVQGDGVPVWYQSSDSQVLAAAATRTAGESSSLASRMSSASTAQTPTSTPPPTGSPAVQPESTSSSGGLSTGAKIGLGVGIPVAIIFGLVLGWLIFRRRKAKAVPAGTHEMSESEQYPYHGAYSPEDARSKTYYAHTSELDGQLHEMPDHHDRPQELPAESRSELR